MGTECPPVPRHFRGRSPFRSPPGPIGSLGRQVDQHSLDVGQEQQAEDQTRVSLDHTCSADHGSVDYGASERRGRSRAVFSKSQAGPGIAPSASLIRVQTFMFTTTPTISRISSGLKFSASASWKRWNAASRSVSAARVSASV